MSHFIDKETIKADLLDYVDALANALFDSNKIDSDSYGLRVGAKGSLVIGDDGLWYSHEDGEGGGDLISLIQWVKDCDFREALEWAEEFLLELDSKISAVKKKPAKSLNDTKAYALTLWDKGGPIDGTLARRYLRKRNILTISKYTRKRLRFLSELKHPNSGKYYPALIAKVQEPDGSFGGIFRIYLSPDGTTKANENPNKLRLGKAPGA